MAVAVAVGVGPMFHTVQPVIHGCKPEGPPFTCRVGALGARRSRIHGPAQREKGNQLVVMEEEVVDSCRESVFTSFS